MLYSSVTHQRWQEAEKASAGHKKSKVYQQKNQRVCAAHTVWLTADLWVVQSRNTSINKKEKNVKDESF